MTPLQLDTGTDAGVDRSQGIVRCSPVPVSALALALMSCVAPAPVRDLRGGAAVPPTRTVEVVDDYHGTRISDPYRWLEEVAAAEVREWAAAQTGATRALVGNSPLRSWLVSRIEAHAAGWDAFEASAPPTSMHVGVRLASVADDGRRRIERVTPDGSTTVLVDPVRYGPGRSVTRLTPSPDGSHAVFEISAHGSEWVTTRVLRVADGATLPDSLDGLRFAPPVWTRDGRGFFYVHYERPRAGESVALRAPSARYHSLGTSQAADRMIHRTPSDNVELLLGLTLTPDGRRLLLTEGTGAATEGLGQLLSRMMLLDLGDAAAPDLTQPLVPLTSALGAGFRLVGEGADGALHVLTDHGAPRRRMVAIDPRDPSPTRWRDIILERADVLHVLTRVGSRYVATYLRDAQALIRVYDQGGTLQHTLELPPFSTVVSVSEGWSDDELLIGTMSFLRPPRHMRMDLATGDTVSLPAPEPSLLDGPYRVRRVSYPSRDGTIIPMFIVHQAGIALDGSHPVLLRGYGSSHDPSLPEFDERVLAWLELGGVYALPNVRGGGEFGRHWWEAAILDRKQTTFDDFITAAEYLISERWTSPEHLAINGASYGGLLVTAVLTQRPDLFAAAVAEVPVTDALRFPFGRHIAQYGSASNPDQFPFLHAYSPQHRIRPGTCYPATLLTTALNDERVAPWAAFKFTAALQAAQGCSRAVALRVDAGGGHAGASPDWISNEVDVLAFIARAVGLAGPRRAR